MITKSCMTNQMKKLGIKEFALTQWDDRSQLRHIIWATLDLMRTVYEKSRDIGAMSSVLISLLGTSPHLTLHLGTVRALDSPINQWHDRHREHLNGQRSFERHEFDDVCTSWQDEIRKNFLLNDSEYEFAWRKPLRAVENANSIISMKCAKQVSSRSFLRQFV